MKKSARIKAKQDQINATSSYGLKNKLSAKKIDKKDGNIKDVKETKHKLIIPNSIRINKNNIKDSSIKIPSVLSTIIRRKTKQSIDASVSKAMPVRVRAKKTNEPTINTNETTIKTNESIAKTSEPKSRTNDSTVKTKESLFKTKKCSIDLTQLTMKTATQIPKTSMKNNACAEGLNKRFKKLNVDCKQTKIIKHKLIYKKTTNNSSKIQSTVKNIATPQSAKPTRILRVRNVVPNKYKEYNLDSPLITKSQKTNSPNPMAVYEFEVDPAEVSTKNKNEIESSDDENNSMKIILKKLRQRHKKVIKKKKSKSKPANEKQKIKEQEQNTVAKEKKQETTEGETRPTCSGENCETKPNHTDEKQSNLTEKNIPLTLISNNNNEMMPLSISNDPVSPIDPLIQARNIVDEVTKSFIEDLSDEEINSGSSGNKNIISNIVLKDRRLDNRKKDFFNSTTNDFKPSHPWRINVSAIKKRPQNFSYKDKCFTPRYDHEIITINDTTIYKKIDSKIDNLDNNKRNFQTSILDFVNSKTKIQKNKVVANKSPRKVLGEINFLQSTPIKPNINTNILKSPNISIITQKKNDASIFGFSYFSDEENKENSRQSPRKIKFKSPKPITISEKEKSISPINTEITMGLFQDISKKQIKTYVRKNPKRKRLPSLDTEPSDDEPEPEKPDRKKQKNALTKQEEDDVNKIASHYNSMFEEIENYPLLIE